jgi:hypothetical protein
LLLALVVTAANVDDGTATPDVLRRLWGEEFLRLELLWADGRYEHNKRLGPLPGRRLTGERTSGTMADREMGTWVT